MEAVEVEVVANLLITSSCHQLATPASFTLQIRILLQTNLACVCVERLHNNKIHLSSATKRMVDYIIHTPSQVEVRPEICTGAELIPNQIEYQT